MPKHGWLTPNSLPTQSVCRVVRIPDDLLLVAAFSGALLDLTRDYNWEAFGEITPDEAASACLNVVLEYLDSECMIGAVFPYITENPPENSLLCDGSQYDRADYPTLYSRLPAALIVDADHFVVPDLRESFIFAAGGSYDPLDTGGAETVTLTEAQMPSHTHTDAGHSHSEIGSTPSAGGEIPAVAGAPSPAATGVGFANIQSAGGGEAHENMPPFTVLAYAVWAR